MSNWQPKARATADVSFDPDGRPKGAEVQVDSYEVDLEFNPDTDDHDDEFRDGASAKLHFTFEDGTAVLDGVKDPASKAYGTMHSSWDFGPAVLRTFPLGQRAVEQLPFVDDVVLVDDLAEEQLSIGWEAEWEE